MTTLKRSRAKTVVKEDDREEAVDAVSIFETSVWIRFRQYLCVWVSYKNTLLWVIVSLDFKLWLQDPVGVSSPVLCVFFFFFFIHSVNTGSSCCSLNSTLKVDYITILPQKYENMTLSLSIQNMLHNANIKWVSTVFLQGFRDSSTWLRRRQLHVSECTVNDYVTQHSK